MSNQDIPNFEIYDLPPGLYRSPTTPKPIRWPNDLYGDLNKICSAIKEATGKTVSVSRITIFVMKEFREKNKHLIQKK